ncbi:MAG: hypothetical protein ABII22_07110 [Candidatus Micrarchaeota archaeon]
MTPKEVKRFIAGARTPPPVSTGKGSTFDRYHSGPGTGPSGGRSETTNIIYYLRNENGEVIPIGKLPSEPTMTSVQPVCSVEEEHAGLQAEKKSNRFARGAFKYLESVNDGSADLKREDIATAAKMLEKAIGLTADPEKKAVYIAKLGELIYRATAIELNPGKNEELYRLAGIKYVEATEFTQNAAMRMEWLIYAIDAYTNASELAETPEQKKIYVEMMNALKEALKQS